MSNLDLMVKQRQIEEWVSQAELQRLVQEAHASGIHEYRKENRAPALFQKVLHIAGMQLIKTGNKMIKSS